MQHEPFEPLETARLRLRCVTPEDASAVSAMMTPKISRWVAYWPVPFTNEMAVARIESSRKLARDGDALPFAVVEKVSGELVGWVMLNREPELYVAALSVIGSGKSTTARATCENLRQSRWPPDLSC